MSPAIASAPPAVLESDKQLALAAEVAKQTQSYDAKFEKLARIQLHCAKAVVAAVRELGDRIGG